MRRLTQTGEETDRWRERKVVKNMKKRDRQTERTQKGLKNNAIKAARLTAAQTSTAVHDK
jgi:hypothetical protein